MKLLSISCLYSIKEVDKIMNYNSHPKMKYIYVGIDCHKHIHVATIINCFNEKIITITFNNGYKGFKFLIKTVNKYKNDLIPVYGLEDTKHLGYELAIYLLSKKCKVKHVNSNLTAAERKKNPIITKNDMVNSQCIAKVLLDELYNLPNATVDEIYWTLKQLVKMRKTIANNNVELKNKLHAQLMHHYPNYDKIYANIFCDTALNLCEKYPSPQLILEENFDDLVSNLKIWSNGNTGARKATKIIELVKSYQNDEITYQAERNLIIQMLVKEIKNNNERIKELETKIIEIYDTMNCKLHTYPCLSKLSSACLLSEIGDIARFKNSGKLAKYAGIAPIEKSSGGVEKAYKNNFGNRELNSMFYTLACLSICTGRGGNTPFNAIFKEYYNKKINEGKTKHQALVCIMRRTCNIVYGILKNNVEYQPPTNLIEECKNSFRERKRLEKKKKELKKQKKKITADSKK